MSARQFDKDICGKSFAPHTQVKRVTQHVLFYLGSFTNGSSDLVFASVKQIAEATGWSEREVQYALRELTKAGIIIPVKSTWRGSQKPGANHYLIMWRLMREQSPQYLKRPSGSAYAGSQYEVCPEAVQGMEKAIEEIKFRGAPPAPQGCTTCTPIEIDASQEIDIPSSLRSDGRGTAVSRHGHPCYTEVDMTTDDIPVRCNGKLLLARAAPALAVRATVAPLAPKPSRKGMRLPITDDVVDAPAPKNTAPARPARKIDAKPEILTAGGQTVPPPSQGKGRKKRQRAAPKTLEERVAEQTAKLATRQAERALDDKAKNIALKTSWEEFRACPIWKTVAANWFTPQFVKVNRNLLEEQGAMLAWLRMEQEDKLRFLAFVLGSSERMRRDNAKKGDGKDLTPFDVSYKFFLNRRDLWALLDPAPMPQVRKSAREQAQDIIRAHTQRPTSARMQEILAAPDPVLAAIAWKREAEGVMAEALDF